MVLNISYQKTGKWVSKKYREFIREKSCLRCGETIYSDQLHDNHHEDHEINNSGMGMRPPDTQQVPLCFECHRVSRSNMGPKEFWGDIDYKKAMINYITEYLIQENIK